MSKMLNYFSLNRLLKSKLYFFTIKEDSSQAHFNSYLKESPWVSLECYLLFISFGSYLLQALEALNQNPFCSYSKG